MFSHTCDNNPRSWQLKIICQGADYVHGGRRLGTIAHQQHTIWTPYRDRTVIEVESEESRQARAISEVPQQQQRWRETPGLVSQPDGGKGTEEQVTKTPVGLTPSRALSASRTSPRFATSEFRIQVWESNTVTILYIDIRLYALSILCVDSIYAII